MKETLKKEIDIAVELSLLEHKNKGKKLLIDGSETEFGSKEHIVDLKKTLSGLERVRDCFPRGSANRHRYSQALSHLKNLIKTLEPELKSPSSKQSELC